MSKNIVFSELRWFFDGPIPSQVEEWFSKLDGTPPRPKSRDDVYLIVTGRDDFGVKLREGNLELKWRTGSEPFKGQGREEIGFKELWDKRGWKYSNEELVDAGFEAPDLAGPRVKVHKMRRQRKYEVDQSGAFGPVSIVDQPDRACVIELTGLKRNGEPAWTLGFDAIGTADEVDKILAQGVERLLAAYTGPALTSERSFGYPKWLALTAD